MTAISKLRAPRPIERHELRQQVDSYLEQLEYDRENAEARLFRINGEIELCQKLYAFMAEF